MAISITYFVHGTSTDNEQHISSGWKDVELSELGRKQANELKDLMQDKHFDAVFCSDLRRAEETARIAFGGRVEIIPDTRLRECNYGEYNGEAESTVGPLKQTNIERPFPEGESYEDVQTRIADFLNFIKQNYTEKKIAIVSHEGPQLSLDVLLAKKTWPQAFAENWRNTKSWQPGWKYELK